MFGSQDTKKFEVAGKPLKCLVCDHEEFTKREAQLNTAMASFFNVDWLNKTALCFVCERCGYIHWFVP